MLCNTGYFKVVDVRKVRSWGRAGSRAAQGSPKARLPRGRLELGLAGLPAGA